MIQGSAILLEHVSCFSYCLLIIKLYWGVKWITIKKNVYWTRCKYTDTPENFLFHDLKEALLVSTNSHQFLLRTKFHPALPCAPAEHLFRASCHCSVHTDEWREYCWDSAWKWAQVSAAVAARSTKVLVIQPHLSLPLGIKNQEPAVKKTYHRHNCNLMSKKKKNKRGKAKRATQRDKVLIDHPPAWF